MWNKAHQGFSPQSASDELKMSPRVTRMKSSFLSFSPLFHSFSSVFPRLFFFSSPPPLPPSILLFLLASSKSFFPPPPWRKRGGVSRQSRLRTGINWSAIGDQFVENRNSRERGVEFRRTRGFLIHVTKEMIRVSFDFFERIFRKDEDNSLCSLSVRDEEPLINTNLVNDEHRDRLAWFM